MAPSYTKRGPSNLMIALAAIVALASIGLAIWSSLRNRAMNADPRAQVFVPRAAATVSLSPTPGNVPTPTPSASPTEVPEIEPGDYRTYHNNSFDYSISYPSNYLIMQGASPANGDGRNFASKDGRVEMVVYARNNTPEQCLREIYDGELKSNRVVTYKKFKDKWFVVSGFEDNKVFYQKTILEDDVVKTFRIESDRELQPIVQPMTEKIVKSFK